MIRLKTSGRIDFCSLENAIAGRGRLYRRVVIDEAAFTKDGDNRADHSMMALWEKAIKPTPSGSFIEDKNSGTILLQQAGRRQMPARAIQSKLTAMGKDERAISMSGYVHREWVKYTDRACHKTAVYKRRSLNHLLDQIESLRVGDKGSDREDDLLDTFCYGIALALGNSEGSKIRPWGARRQ